MKILSIAFKYHNSNDIFLVRSYFKYLYNFFVKGVKFVKGNTYIVHLETTYVSLDITFSAILWRMCVEKRSDDVLDYGEIEFLLYRYSHPSLFRGVLVCD